MPKRMTSLSNKVLTVPTVNGDTGATGVAGCNGLTPNIQFSVDLSGNLRYEITYTNEGCITNPDERVIEW